MLNTTYALRSAIKLISQNVINQKALQPSIELGLQINDELADFPSSQMHFTKMGAYKRAILSNIEKTVSFGVDPSSKVEVEEDIDNYDECMEMVEEYSTSSSTTHVRLAPRPAYDKFTEALRKLKKIENIKSNATAFGMMCDLAIERMDQLAIENAEDEQNNESVE